MRPFEGIRVIDLTHVFAGPFCTCQLAALGADVIKIEPPGSPDMTRAEGVDAALNDEGYGTTFHAQNAGKRAITLDLRHEAAREVMRRLIAGADVLVQNYAAGALDRLGFGYESVSAINPRLIYCTLTGYGRTGPKADHPAYDVVIQAFTGLMAANGTPETTPVRVGPAVVDYGTGAQAALAVSAALFQRQHTGQGQKIDVAMADAALMLMSSSVVETIATGASPRPHGNIAPTLAGYRSYQASDGPVMIGAFTNRQLARLFEALGEAERAAEILVQTNLEARAPWTADSETIARHIATRTAAEWEARLNAAHIPAARVRRIDETLADPQLATRQVIQVPPGAVDPRAPARLPVAAFTYAHGTPAHDRPPPRLGEHNAEVLAELGYGAAEVEELRRAGAV